MTKILYNTGYGRLVANLSIDLDYMSNYTLEDMVNLKNEAEKIIKELSTYIFKEGEVELDGKVAKGETKAHLAINIPSWNENMREIIIKQKISEKGREFERDFFWDMFSKGINTGVYATTKKLTKDEHDSLDVYMEFPNKPFQIGNLALYLYSVPSP